MDQTRLTAPDANPCARCVELAILGSGGGWHPLTHIAVGAREICVDIGIAEAVAAVWEADLATTQSCEAWQWWPDPLARPNYARIDFRAANEAGQAAELLGIRAPLIEPNRWNGHSLLWLPSIAGTS